ncbi:MAG: acetate--CoA ligase [Sandaracinus sp.]|nr:acetate--CoA ligase [Sandaracinus sp.]
MSDDIFPTKAEFSSRARVQSMDEYRELHERSLRDPGEFWGAQAGALSWYREPDTVLQTEGDGEFAWFGGGRLNVAVNCVDRHAAKTPDKTAIIWAKNEPGEYEHITFRDLKARVGRMANLLREKGVQRGDRVCLYLPMVPELAISMLACARIGAVHSVVFGGFSAEALRDRILDAGARVLITADQGPRGAKNVELKRIADQAVEGLDLVEHVLVVQRTGSAVTMVAGRDEWLHEAVARHRTACPAEWMSAEDPLFILYTSGSTGRPKGLVHTTAGYLLYASFTHRYVFDTKDDDVYFCAADVGWITGHSYIVYGPLANGVTTVMFESTPTFPDATRYWQVVDDIGATIFYTSPTALRVLRREGAAGLAGSSRKSIRLLGTVGEPINPDVWQWYHDVVGEGRCPIVDTWWQTETGGVLISPLPGATPLKPGSATFPMPGVEPVLVDDQGVEIEGNGVEGKLCIRGPWPGQARTIYKDHERYLKTYFRPFPGYYFTGDGCRRDDDGYYWITGRVDDVINVSGHRIGTAEIESALVAHEAVAEAAVVPVPHEIKGQGIFAWVMLSGEEEWNPDELVGALKEQVRHIIGPIATPDRVRIVEGLPKTRSGKIMRRILRKIAAGQTSDLGDLSTLADASVVDALLRSEGLTPASPETTAEVRA